MFKDYLKKHKKLIIAPIIALVVFLILLFLASMMSSQNAPFVYQFF